MRDKSNQVGMNGAVNTSKSTDGHRVSRSTAGRESLMKWESSWEISLFLGSSPQRKSNSINTVFMKE